jgi:hypothetical protein
MNRFLFVLVLLVACGIGLGFYRGWFNLTVDQDKMQADEKSAEDRVRGTK